VFTTFQTRIVMVMASQTVIMPVLNMPDCSIVYKDGVHNCNDSCPGDSKKTETIAGGYGCNKGQNRHGK